MVKYVPLLEKDGRRARQEGPGSQHYSAHSNGTRFDLCGFQQESG